MKGSTDPRAFSVVSYEEPAAEPRQRERQGGGNPLEHPERIFARFDRNHDGKITQGRGKNTHLREAVRAICWPWPTQERRRADDQGNQRHPGSRRQPEAGHGRALHARPQESVVQRDEDGARLLRQRQTAEVRPARRRAAARPGQVHHRRLESLVLAGLREPHVDRDARRRVLHARSTTWARSGKRGCPRCSTCWPTR